MKKLVSYLFAIACALAGALTPRTALAAPADSLPGTGDLFVGTCALLAVLGISCIMIALVTKNSRRS